MATKFRDLVKFASELQSSRIGMTKKEMVKRCQELGLLGSKASIRTIDRWIDQLKCEFDLEIHSNIYEADRLQKRFKITSFPNILFDLTDQERNGLERLKESLTENIHREAISKVLASQKPLSNRVFGDLTELIDNTSYASQIAPRQKVNHKYMQIVEDAIKGYTKIRFHYQSQSSSQAKLQEVSPIGLIFSRFGYLVALYLSKKPIIYRLDLLQNVESTNFPSDRDEEFNFRKWSEESFGIFHGDKIFRAEIKFSKKVAHSVKNIKFHPSQVLRENKDKSITLIVICRGMREFIYELLNPLYLGEFKIIKPMELQEEFKKYLCTSVLAIK